MATSVSASLSEQLAPIAGRQREARARIRPVSQALLRLTPDGGQDPFTATIDKVLKWLAKRAGSRLPESAWQRKSFELDAIGAQRLAAVSLEQPRFWAARLDDADKDVPRRTWVTEIGIGLDGDGSVIVGARLTCATRGEDAPFDRSVPGFLRSIVDGVQATLDGYPMPAKPVVVADDDGVDRLVDLLEDPRRRHPVIVLALPDGVTDPARTAVDAQRVRERSLGAVHVVVITGPASYRLSELIGKEFSVFRQAVRLYRPGFRRWRSNPYEHPLALPDRIKNWPDGGPDAYLNTLVSQALAITAHAADREDVIPSFEHVRRYAAQAARQAVRDAGGSDKELLALADEELRKLEAELSEQKRTYDGLLTDLEAQLTEAREARDEALSQQYPLRRRIESLQAKLVSAGGATPIPDTLDGFEAWCEEHLSGSVMLLSRAFRGAKQSVYESQRFVYEALLLLRDHYVPMRRDPSEENKARFDCECRRLRIENAPVGEATRTHSEHYTVRYGGKPRLLDWHLKRGDARERTRCFRLYYFWDDDTQCVVVGWLPSHLDNSLT